MDSAIIPPPDPTLAERTELALTLGRMLFRYGASTQRIIDSMDLLHSYLGEGQLEVLVTYDAITVTALEGGRSCTRIDASREVAGVNIHGQGQIRRLLLDDAASKRDADYFRNRLREIAAEPDLAPIYPWKWLVAGVVSAAFCAFNGGDAAATGITIAASLVVFAVRAELLRRQFTIYLATLGSVCAGGLVAAILARFGWSATPDIALIAPVLFLVPGAPMITGGMDITRNHNSVGLARIAYTLAITATISLGLAPSLPLLTGIAGLAAVANPHPWLTVIIDTGWGALGGAGLALLNGAHWRAIRVCAICGAAARLLRETGVDCGIDIATATLLAAVVTTLLAIQLGRQRRMPSVMLAVMGCLTLIPGFYAISGARALFHLSQLGMSMPWPDAAHGFQMLLQAGFIAFAIIVGIIFTFMVVERGTRRV